MYVSGESSCIESRNLDNALFMEDIYERADVDNPTVCAFKHTLEANQCGFVLPKRLLIVSFRGSAGASGLDVAGICFPEQEVLPCVFGDQILDNGSPELQADCGALCRLTLTAAIYLVPSAGQVGHFVCDFLLDGRCGRLLT